MSNSTTNIFEIGNVINDKWVILELIGKGAMGEIYLAHQLNLKRDVAIKVVSHELLKEIGEDPEEVDVAFQRFQREVHAMAKVRHPNVLQIFDHGSTVIGRGHDECPVEFIAMEYIPGDTLRFTMSEEGFFPEEELTKTWIEDYFLPLLDGVEAIHSLDIIHRDLKPENILLDGDTPKIADFGLARSNRLKPVTQSMDVKGTAHYMSPEHFFDFRKADQRADIYSLGKILFEAVNGKINGNILPFKTARLSDPDTPFYKKLDEIIQEATAENKENRLPSIVRFRKALGDAIDQLKTRQNQKASSTSRKLPFLHDPKWIWVGIFAVIISVGAMAMWHMIGEPETGQVLLDSSKNITEEPAPFDQSKISNVSLPPPGKPGQTLLTVDGANLHFISGGIVNISEQNSSLTPQKVTVNSFYMDETHVTNHQFVEYLNHHLTEIQVERGVVRVDEEIWLLLGEVSEDFEPIVFTRGEFKVTQATYASLPVLRVTATGASAYARFYNRRLPTYAEWLLALGNEAPQSSDHVGTPNNSAGEKGVAAMHAQMHSKAQKQPLPTAPPLRKIEPVIDFQPNRFGIRGLNSTIKEWGIWIPQAASRDKVRDIEYVVLPSTVLRYPWEAFAEVGFRCVQDVK